MLQGVEMPLDGRTIIVENGLNPQGNAPARHSMPGDVIRLVLPEEIAAFAAYRRTMAFIFDDRQIGSSERGQAYEAIVEAIRLTNHPNYRGAANKMEQFLLSLMVKRPVATILAGAILLLIACERDGVFTVPQRARARDGQYV